jgi:hypothetical protein
VFPFLQSTVSGSQNAALGKFLKSEQPPISRQNSHSLFVGTIPITKVNLPLPLHNAGVKFEKME